jgi:hypothetical protein
MGSSRPQNSTCAERARLPRSVYWPSPPIPRRLGPLAFAPMGLASAWEGRP